MAEPASDGVLPTTGTATAVAERPAAAAPASEGFSSSRMDGGLRDALRGYIGKSREVADATRQASVSIDNLQPPKIPEMPKPPQQTTTDFATMFGSAAMSLAGLGSLMTRRPFTQALKSGAAVMDAYRKNDLQAAQQAFQTWQMETQNAMRMHQFEQEAYRNSIEKLKLKPELARAELTALAASFKDEVALGMLNRGDVQGALSVITGRGRLGGSISSSQSQLVQQQKDFVDLQTARGRLQQAQQSGDPAAIAEAEQQIEAVRLRARDRAEMRNPLAFEREDRLASSPDAQIKQLRLDATTALLEARESGDPAKIKAAEQALADVSSRARSSANAGLTDRRITAKAATDMAEAEIARRTREGKPPTLEEEVKIRQDALREAAKKAPLPPAIRTGIETKMNQVTQSANLIKPLLQDLENKWGMSSLMGRVRRGTETVGNILGSDSVEAKRFQTNVSLLKGVLGQAMSASASRPLAADVKRVEELLDIVGLGRTTATVHEALQEIENLLYQQQQLDKAKLVGEFDENFQPKQLERRPLSGPKKTPPPAGARRPDFSEYEPE